MTPIKQGTAQKLGLRKPPHRYNHSRDGMEPDPTHSWARLGMTWREDETWLIEWAQQELGVTFAPWQRWTLEQYIANRP